MPHELSFDIYSQPVSDVTGSASSFSDTSVDLQSFVQSEAPRESPEREGFITWIDFIDELLKQPMQESSALLSPGIVKRYFGDNSHQNVNSADTFPSIPSAECQSGLEVSVKNNSKRSRPYTRESPSYDCNVESIQLDQSSRKRQMASGEDPRAVRTFNTLECSFVDQKQPGNLLVDAKLAPSHSNAGTRMPHNRPNISNAEPFTRIIPSTSPRAYSFSGSFPHSPAASTPSHCSSSTKPAVLAQQSCQFIPSDSFSVSQTASYDEMRSFQQRSGALTTNSIADPKFSSFLTSNPCTSLQDAQAVKVDKSLSVQVESMNATHSNKKILTQRSKQGHDAINPVHSSPQQEPSGIQLVHLLLSCAEAISKKSYSTAKENLLQLQRKVLLDTGDSVHRVVAHFTEALLAKINGTGSRSYVAIKSHEEISSEDILAAYNVLYQVCPYMKFGHFTCNQAIFEAFEGHSRVHILDLDILQGYQWPSLIQALATRPGGAPFLRITGVGKTLHTLHETGKRLADLASTLSVPFEFQAVGESLENLHSFMIERAPGEILAVNCVNRLHRLLTEPRNSSIEGVLRLIRDLSPSRVTIVEQEASHNAPNFLPRFLEALHYFSAIFDSLDATLPRTSHDRAKVESTIFSNEITNIVACEGAERIERHEKLETWTKIMESMGFQSVPLSANGINQCKLLLGLYPCDGYSAVEADKDGLILRWQDRAILGVSVWR